MQTKIKIPDAVKDMKIGQVRFITELVRLIEGDESHGKKIADIDQEFIDNLDPVIVADLNAAFFMQEDGSFDKYTNESNRKLLNEIIESFSKYEPSPLELSYTVDDQRYVMISEFDKMPVSFWRDIKMCDFEENPEDIIAFTYIEEGMTYNEIDKNKNIINPRKKRKEALCKELNLADYLDVQGFFWRVGTPFAFIQIWWG